MELDAGNAVIFTEFDEVGIVPQLGHLLGDVLGKALLTEGRPVAAGGGEQVVDGEQIVHIVPGVLFRAVGGHLLGIGRGGGLAAPAVLSAAGGLAFALLSPALRGLCLDLGGGRLFRRALLPGVVGLLIAAEEELVENINDDNDRDDFSHGVHFFSLVLRVG